jgi:hypothetical protein
VPLGVADRAERRQHVAQQGIGRGAVAEVPRRRRRNVGFMPERHLEQPPQPVAPQRRVGLALSPERRALQVEQVLHGWRVCVVGRRVQSRGPRLP